MRVPAWAPFMLERTCVRTHTHTPIGGLSVLEKVLLGKPRCMYDWLVREMDLSAPMASPGRDNDA